MENTGHTSSVEQSRGGDEARNSDSGDSIFLTQKPVPEAVRSGGRRLPRLESAWTQEGPADLEDDRFSSSSSSDGESRTDRKKRRPLKVPTCRFSFLTERKGQTNGLPRVKIKKLHSYVIGGYMKHVQELWESYGRGVDVAASLPTVDVEGISPLSEEEKDEAIENEDIKVVERTHFATSVKAKSSRPWCALKTRSSKKRKQSHALNGSPGQQQKTVPEVSTSKPESPSSATQTSRDEDTRCGDLKETEAQATSDAETGNHPKEKKKRLGDESGATLSLERRTQGGGDAHTEVLRVDEQSHLGKTGHENGNPPQSVVNNGRLCLKKRREKKGGKGACKGVEKGTEQIQDETEGQHEEELLCPPEDINVNGVPESKLKEKKKKPSAEGGGQDGGSAEEASVSSTTEADWKKKKKDVDGGRTTPAATPPTDEIGVPTKKAKKKKDLNVTSDPSQSPTEHHLENTEAPRETELKRKKHKKKKKKKKNYSSAGEEVSFSNDAVTNTILTSRKKKRKKKVVDISHDAEEDENFFNKQKEEQDPELKSKKKKQTNNWSVSTCEDTVALVNYSALVRGEKEEKGTSSFLAADEEESGAEEQRKPSQSEAQKPDVSAADLAARSAENACLDKLKDGVEDKKKKRTAVQGCVERETGFKEPSGTPAVEVKKKRKCKRSDGELTSPTERSLEESQTDAAVPQKKKKKKKDKIPPAATKDAEAEAATLTIFSSDSQKKKREKAANKLSPAKKSSPKAAESEARETKQTERTETDLNFSSKTSPLGMKRKNNKKRKLYNPDQDFLPDF